MIYIGQVLNSLELYKNSNIITTNKFNQLNAKKKLFVIVDKTINCKNFSTYITISNKKTADILKPLHISNLINLINTKLKILNNYIFLENFSFSFNKKVIINNQNQLLNLTEKKANLLRLLLKLPNHFISKKKILQEIWHYKADLEIIYA